MKTKRIIILGGGLSGLAAGEILSKHFQVTILESAPFLGGLASNFEYNGKFIPKYYHHIIKSNKLLFLPPYSPELNPIERVWKLTRRLCLHNQYFEQLETVIKSVEGRFQCWCNANEHPNLTEQIKKASKSDGAN